MFLKWFLSSLSQREKKIFMVKFTKCFLSKLYALANINVIEKKSSFLNNIEKSHLMENIGNIKKDQHRNIIELKKPTTQNNFSKKGYQITVLLSLIFLSAKLTLLMY